MGKPIVKAQSVFTLDHTLASQLAAKVVPKGLAAAGHVVATEVKRRLKPGAMRESVVVKASANGKRLTVGFSDPAEGFKAEMLEFGHMEITQGPGRRRVGHVPARPFMRPAFDASSDDAEAAFGSAMSAGLDALTDRDQD